VPRRHFLPIALALFACCVAGAGTVVAQTAQDPQKLIFPDPAQTPPQKLIYPAPAQTQPQKLIYPAPAPTPPQKLIYPNPAPTPPQKLIYPPPPPAKPQPDPLLMRPMRFYQAHGAANACGPGCSEWIAAEGKIDTDTADRLRHLLGQLGGARPPMFLYSPGGSAIGSMELGRLVRARKMTVSVGHTVPLSCESDPASEKSCEPQIKAGHAIEAELDPGKTTCNSGCVYVVAGGAVRLVPPWVTLGIHDVGFLPREHGHQFSADAIEYAKSIADGRLRSYMREMGIEDGLWKEAFATPFSSLKPLFRDDIVRFGMDRRDFAETVWHFVNRSGARIVKLFFVGSETTPPSFINGFVEVSCGRAPGSYLWVFGRDSVPTDTFVQPPVNVSLNDKPFQFLRQISNPKYFVRSARLTAAPVEGVADSATIVLPGTDYRRQEGPAGDVTLAMLGFPAAFAKLQDACATQTATPAAPPATPSATPASSH
jgi:hypothetical protein